MTRDADFVALFTARVRAVRRTAYLMCGDWNRAEDLTQAAFTKLYAAWPRLRDAAAAEAYLRRTLLNTCLDDSRRRWRGEESTAEVPERPAHSIDVDDRAMLLRALERVPARQRACLVLRFYDDLSVEATAATLGCSVGTVKSNTSRGLDALRRVLQDAADPDLMNEGAR